MSIKETIKDTTNKLKSMGINILDIDINNLDLELLGSGKNAKVYKALVNNKTM